MASYSIQIKPSAKRELIAIRTKKDRLRIVRRIQSLASDPRPNGCEKLSGNNRFRVRQGNDRIVYEIHDDDIVVIIIRIGHRRDIYRKLKT